MVVRIGGCCNERSLPPPHLLRCNVEASEMVRGGLCHKQQLAASQACAYGHQHDRLLACYAHLHKALHDGALEEVAVGLVDAPVDLGKDLAGLGACEVVLLAVKGVKELVVAGGDVPAALELRRVKVVIEHADGRHGVRALRVLLRHAVLVAHGAAVEGLHCLVLVLVTTPAATEQVWVSHSGIEGVVVWNALVFQSGVHALCPDCAHANEQAACSAGICEICGPNISQSGAFNAEACQPKCLRVCARTRLFECVGALDLALFLIGPAIACVETHEVLQAVDVCQAARQLRLAAAQQAGADGGGICRRIAG